MTIENPALLDLFRWGPCTWCRKRGPTDPHHLFARGMGGGGRLDIRPNLVALCRVCHTEFHSGNILRTSLMVMVAQREDCLVMDIEAVVWMFRRLPKGASREQIEEFFGYMAPSERALAEKTLKEVMEVAA